MSRAEVQEHIGTIAKSGTKQFFEALTGEQAKDSELIGQFGVGFYSAFIVADKVTLTTRKAGSTEATRWESAGEGDYTIENVEKSTRGTEIVLHLKEGESEFLDGWKLRSIVRKFSDHISLPIVMDKEVQSEFGDDEDETAEKAVPEIVEETINNAAALWTKSRQEISDDDYSQFYKHVSHDFKIRLRTFTAKSKAQTNTHYCCTFQAARLLIYGIKTQNTA